MLTAVSLLMLIPVLALAINIGQLYYAQRDLEKQATLAALSAVQISSGCAVGGVPAQMSAITAEVTSVIAANSVDGANSVQGLLTGINGSPAVEVGTIVSTSGFRKFMPLAIGNENITAVRVN
ncbi:pilus assembly protein TadG-related protein, partial [uncultured Nevskia sp.]|uniref:pilus assembly protein TadG-related protein n=1 Tax=uncultured Nevskia sp. TaxID=228950 RepID=UPI0025E11B79